MYLPNFLNDPMLDTVTFLHQELDNIGAQATSRLAGVGVIVHDGSHGLPVYPLRQVSPPPFKAPLSEYLLQLCDESSPFHDGFHILDSKFRVTAVAQYFSPPIVPETRVDRSRLFGGRYLAALFGSMLPGVLATGVFSCGYGTVVFRQGSEV